MAEMDVTSDNAYRILNDIFNNDTAYDDGYNGGYEKGKEETKHKIVTMLNAYCESLEAEDVKWRKPYVLGIRHSIELIEEIYK